VAPVYAGSLFDVRPNSEDHTNTKESGVQCKPKQQVFKGFVRNAAIRILLYWFFVFIIVVHVRNSSIELAAILSRMLPFE